MKIEKQEYVYYKGDMVLGIGTISELSKKFGLSKKTLRSYASKAHYDRCMRRKSNNFSILVTGE